MPHSREYLNLNIVIERMNKYREKTFLNPVLLWKIWYNGSLLADWQVRNTLASQILQLASMMVFVIHLPSVSSGPQFYDGFVVSVMWMRVNS